MVIVDAGDTAAEEATYLAKICKKVYMIVRKDTMRASKVMQQRVLNTSNIEVIYSSETPEVVGTDQVTGVRILNTTTNEVTEKKIERFFVAIGHTPNIELLKVSSKWTKTTTSSPCQVQRAPVCKVDLLQAMCKTIFTAGDNICRMWMFGRLRCRTFPEHH